MKKLNTILIIIILLVLLIFVLLLTNSNSNSKFSSTKDVLGYVLTNKLDIPNNFSMWYIQPVHCGDTSGTIPTDGYTALLPPTTLRPPAPIILGDVGSIGDVNNNINYLKTIISNINSGNTAWLNNNIPDYNKYTQFQKQIYLQTLNNYVILLTTYGGTYLNMLEKSYLSVCGITQQILAYSVTPNKKIDIFSPDSDYLDLSWVIQPIHCGDKSNNDFRDGYTVSVLPESISPLAPMIMNRKYNDLLSKESNNLLSTTAGIKVFLLGWINNDTTNPVVKDINDGINTFYPGTTKSVNYIKYLNSINNLFVNNDIVFVDQISNNFNKFCSLKETFTANINTNISGNTASTFIIYDLLDSTFNIPVGPTANTNTNTNTNTNILAYNILQRGTSIDDIYFFIQPIHCTDTRSSILTGGYTALISPTSLYPYAPIIIGDVGTSTDVINYINNFNNIASGNTAWIENNIPIYTTWTISQQTKYIQLAINYFKLLKTNGAVYKNMLPMYYNKLCNSLGSTGNIRFAPTGNTGNSRFGPTGNTGNIRFGPTGNTGNTGNIRFGPTGNTGNTGNIRFGPTGNTGNIRFGPTGNTGIKIPERIGNTGNIRFGPTGNTGGNNLISILYRYYDTSALGKTGNTIFNVLNPIRTGSILKSSTTDIVKSIKNLLSTTDIGFSYYSTSTMYIYTIFNRGTNYSKAILEGGKLKNKIGAPPTSVSYIISSIYYESNNSSKLYSN